MCTRRKDIWTLLYNLVARNGIDTNDVFTFVDDILCREPSLIRPSLHELNNRFQDTFILWIVNKLVKALVDGGTDVSNNTFTSDGLYERNIHLQQKILHSCFVNRALLFERLVGSYIKAIEQLTNGLQLLDENTATESKPCLEITAFFSEDLCLREIDENFSFEKICVPQQQVDERVRSLLGVLHNAVVIGYVIFPALFVESLLSALLAVRDCDLITKLHSLRYCQDVFELARECTPSLEHFAKMSIEALSMIWSQVEFWLHMQCMTLEELDSLREVTIAMLKALTRFGSEMQWARRNMVQQAINLLYTCIELEPQKLEEDNDSKKQEELLSALIDFILDMPLNEVEESVIVVEADKIILSAERSDKILPVLGVIAARAQRDNGDQVSACLRALKIFKQTIFNTLDTPELKVAELKRLKIWLSALIYAEHRLCRRQQLNSLRKSTTVEEVLEQNHYGSINVFQPLVDAGFSEELNRIVLLFQERITSTSAEEYENWALYMNIAALMMNSSSLRGVLDEKSQISLLTRISDWMHVITQERRPQRHLQVLAFESFRAFVSLHIVDGPVEILNFVRKRYEEFARFLFTDDPFILSDELLARLRESFCKKLHALIACGWISQDQVLRNYVGTVSNQESTMMLMLRNAHCSGIGTTSSIFLRLSDLSKSEPTLQEHIALCQLCNNICQTSAQVEAYMRTHKVILVKCSSSNIQQVKYYNTLPELPVAVRRKLCEVLLTEETQSEYTAIGRHLDLSCISPEEFLSVLENTKDISNLNVRIFPKLIPQLVAAGGEAFVMKLAQFILQQIFTVLQLQSTTTALASSTSSAPAATASATQRKNQLKLLEFIASCAHSDISEIWLFHLFKMTFFFLLHVESTVVQEAVLCATEMCAKHGLQPARLWNWYKRDALTLVVQLAVQIFLQNGVRLTRSLKAFTKMLGFSCVQEFICRYYRLLTTMILPYCVKEPLCKGLIVCISKVTRKPISTIFVASFLRIYTHIYLTEEAEVGNQCIELLVKCTDFSLKRLMNTDVKQTVSEFLIYFNRNPQFVMKAFQCLLFNESVISSATSGSSCALVSNRKSTGNTPSVATSGNTGDFAKFIADRFLGVITYFETCLAEPTFEKSLKEEALFSLGQILRFVGAKHVTQFRFKIIAMLSFVLSLEDRHLQSICLKVWNIFLHIVNIQELGPSLSRIVAALQPLLVHSAAEVNGIYEFVILKNDSLIGAYISDLYFLEQLEHITPAIRQCVARQTEILKNERSTLLDKIGFLYRQITNENSQVRIYGLTYLRNVIAAHRSDINQMVLSELLIDPLFEKIVHTLVTSCKHEDANLQLSSAKCLGELGAIDPSYITANHQHHALEQSDNLPLSVHTDGFAIMALTELCRAYQFQKDTKYVDNFSLAIQETLAVCGVSPLENKKVNVWEAMPARMRQVMEPLLTSCYTNSRRENTCTTQPIFNSSYGRSYAEWAFNWAARLIDFVQAEETKHLLNSYKPSIKRDNNTLVTFFPYILLHALQDATDVQRQRVYEEFTAVFGFSSAGVAEQPECEVSGVKEFVSAKYAADLSPAGLSGQHVRDGTSTEHEALEHISRTCTKLCSEQIDFLERWVREWQRLNSVGVKAGDEDKNYKCVLDFLRRFNKLTIAKANYQSNEYARALMYLEAYIEETDTQQRLQEHISFLIEIYGELLDADSVEGAVYVKKSNLSLGEEIMVNRIVDRPQELQTCYEQLMSSDGPISQDHVKGIINCYLRMDTPETALLITDGLWQKLTDHYTDDYFKECKSELLWRLGRYDELEELLEDSVVRRKTSNWNIQCAEAFLLYRQPVAVNTQAQAQAPLDDFTKRLDVIRQSVMTTMRSCSGVKQISYLHLYEEIIKLHLLNEMEKNKQLIHQIIANYSSDKGDDACASSVRDFFNDWDRRLSVLQPVVRVMEPVLCFRRNLLIESKRLLCAPPHGAQIRHTLQQHVIGAIDTEIGKLWLRSVRMYREAGSLQQAQLCIMKAAEYAPKTLFIEKVKFLWQKGDQSHAFKLLEEQLERMEEQCERNVRSLSAGDRSLYAEAKYLQATYSAESMNSCAEKNLRYFREAIAGNRNSEKCYVQLAQYMEKIYESYSPEQQNGDNGRKLLFDIMVNYAKSLKSGCENIYQSLPRLLSIWLDFTSRGASTNEAASSDPALAVKAHSMLEMANKMNELINSCANALPTATFYTAFSQLLSRICHPSIEVFGVLRTIVIKLLERFPQQSLWMLLPILKSSQTNRVKRCKMIFTDARLAKPPFQKQLNDFNILAERLIELTNKDVAHDRTYELSSLVRQLPKLFEDPKFSNILLPFEKYMQASFPLTSATSSSMELYQFSSGNVEATSSTSSLSSLSSTPMGGSANPFPYKQIYISGINEEVIVLRSAAKPKKISIKCSDGKCYEVMVKPKDDLRKDFRLMEFNGLVKRFLHQDSQARHRCLRIRTYAAIPFNEECGLVEWLPKLNSFRTICNSVYRMRGLGLHDRTLRLCALPRTDPIEKKRSVFLGTLLPAHPPVFQEWLRRRFYTPNSWYEARCAYVKTVAVMSMVGYILGLGDRHGENLLFDETNGDAVHVDFNCLFNQGELFAYPELVPFRLTHNMVFAMGPLGVEGMYRRCCEITMRVLKHQSKTLMSVLRPFVYDLVALNRSFSSTKNKPSLELTDPKALMDVRRIEERLRGYVKRTQANSMPLSTEGQVSFLIAEATSIDNLAAMYIGWGSYI